MARVRLVILALFILALACTLPGSTAAADDSRAAAQTRLSLTRLWVGGDSMAYQIAPTLCAEARKLGVGRCSSLCKSSSGVVRPDFYSWPGHLPVAFRTFRPRAVVFMIGTNDGQGMRAGGSVYAFGSAGWKRVYNSRVAWMMKTMLANGVRRVYWIGMPIMRSATFGKRMALLNSVFKAQAAAHPGVVYVDAWRLFSSASGGFVSGWRSSDGIHFNMTGVHRLCDAVLRLVRRDF